ncbi:hypothetical protein QJ043_06980 [Olsenella sp. YH-ols2217]|uniref:Uncharacterized protein n=1 Tax=Kribbibacterium absianum TaxID=3044210 RepID=A0ABT6ZL89_9ACTN|nr:hypothetical protein [Olsenella sp. YH-ols2217]MDJ1129817.1 hypothetical protein [Olsenella sp. YH-ols2217]
MTEVYAPKDTIRDLDNARHRMLVDYGLQPGEDGRFRLKDLTLALLGRIGISTKGASSRIYKSTYRQLQRYIGEMAFRAAEQEGHPDVVSPVSFPCNADTALKIVGNERICRYMLDLRNKYADLIYGVTAKEPKVDAALIDSYRAIARSQSLRPEDPFAGDTELGNIWNNVLSIGTSDFSVRQQMSLLFSAYLEEHRLVFDNVSYDRDLTNLRGMMQRYQADLAADKPGDAALRQHIVDLYVRFSDLSNYLFH